MQKQIGAAILLGLFSTGILGTASSAYSVIMRAFPASIYVYPSSVENRSLTAGKIFLVEICVNNVSELNSVAFNMRYDTTVLTCLGL